MHHLGIGRRHTGKRILAITDETTATVIHLDTGEILSEHTIDPTRGYWRNNSNQQADGPRNETCLATYETHVARHHMVELRRFELLTSSMRTKRATNCAIAPETA